MKKNERPDHDGRDARAAAIDDTADTEPTPRTLIVRTLRQALEAERAGDLDTVLAFRDALRARLAELRQTPTAPREGVER